MLSLHRSSRMRPTVLFAVLGVGMAVTDVACGGGDTTDAILPAADAAPSPAAPAPDARVDESDSRAPIDSAIPPRACALGISVPRSDFVDASVAYLRAAFGVEDGFQGGAVVYGEMWSSIDPGSPCPLADWTTVSYVVPAPPARVPLELRGTHGFVSAFWALNGRRDVAFLPTSLVTATDPAPFQQGVVADSVAAVAKEGASDAQLGSLIATLTPLHPTVHFEYLEAIRILTLATAVGNFADLGAPVGTVAQIDAVVAKLRASALFSSIEWSGLVFSIPNESWPGVVHTGARIEPECERTKTRQLRDGNFFSSLPSLAPPLGAGFVPNPGACP